MKNLTNNLRICWLTIFSLVLVSCPPRPYRLKYLSFEEVEGITIESTATMEIEDLTFVSEVPVKYALERSGYGVRLIIDRDSYRPTAVVALIAAEGLHLVPRPKLAMKPGRVTPCGTYEERGDKPRELLFSWVICGDYASPSPLEFVVAFDVLDASEIVVGRERLPFELKSAGIFWMNDSL